MSLAFNKARSLLDQLNYPEDLRDMSLSQLEQLASELRTETIEVVANTGGHLGAGLGVVELTLALHYVFNTPDDLLVWDVGHQCYPHKIITGRRKDMVSLRQKDGISGFLKIDESPYDAFGAGHSSTSISAALGLAVARDLQGKHHEVVAIVGDGALSAGMAYEAMNNAAYIKTRLLVILNDNEMSIAPAVGAMSQYLSRLISSPPYNAARSALKGIIGRLPHPFGKILRQIEKYIKGYDRKSNLFEELGFNYIGPIDGHSLPNLITVLSNIKHAPDIKTPILLHVKTQKGKGFDSPEISSESYHAVSKFDPITRVQAKSSGKTSYSEVFARTLISIAKKDRKVVAITAAMPSGTGVGLMADVLPKQVFDVGIAEQHAVTFAAGLAVGGMKPFVAIYSTFLQRAYDQLVHDVAMQRLPVRFIIDRAGLVGPDGPTHAGIYDISYLSNLPNMVVMAAADAEELSRMVLTCYHYNDGPIALRFPKSEATLDQPVAIEPLEIGKGRVMADGREVLLVSLGGRMQEVEKAAKMLIQSHGISPSIIDARFAKPLDRILLMDYAHKHRIVVTIEEGMAGGFGASVAKLFFDEGYLDGGELKMRAITLPDCIIEQATPAEQYHAAGMDAVAIHQLLISML